MDDVLAELADGQALAEDLFLDQCKITREPAEDADWVTGPDGRQTPAQWGPVYEGPCKVQSQQPYEVKSQVGSTTEVTQRYMVHVPVGAGPFEVGDLVVVTSMGDRELRVAGTHHKTFQTAQRLLADEMH